MNWSFLSQDDTSTNERFLYFIFLERDLSQKTTLRQARFLIRFSLAPCYQ